MPLNNHPSDKAAFTGPGRRSGRPRGRLHRPRRGMCGAGARGGSGPGASASRWPPTWPRSRSGRGALSKGRAGGVPSWVMVDPREAEGAAPAPRMLSPVMRFFSGLYGPYPFTSTGAIVDRARRVGYALETQTRPIFDRAPDELVLVHEISHQWFGNSVTPRRWSGIWLNEGFATWSEWIWSERHGGPSARRGPSASSDVAAGRGQGPLEPAAGARRPPAAALRDLGVPARRADPAGPADEGGQPGLLRDPAPLGRGQPLRARDDAQVHRPLGAGLGPAARRVLRPLALREGEAAPAPDGGQRAPPRSPRRRSPGPGAFADGAAQMER